MTDWYYNEIKAKVVNKPWGKEYLVCETKKREALHLPNT